MFWREKCLPTRTLIRFLFSLVKKKIVRPIRTLKDTLLPATKNRMANHRLSISSVVLSFVQFIVRNYSCNKRVMFSRYLSRVHVLREARQLGACVKRVISVSNKLSNKVCRLGSNHLRKRNYVQVS